MIRFGIDMWWKLLSLLRFIYCFFSILKSVFIIIFIFSFHSSNEINVNRNFEMMFDEEINSVFLDLVMVEYELINVSS